LRGPCLFKKGRIPAFGNSHNNEKENMAEKLDPEELVDFKELLMANSIQVDALSQLLIEKRLITHDEFFAKLKQVQAEYQGKQYPNDYQ
jgi:hypothetical protein